MPKKGKTLEWKQKKKSKAHTKYRTEDGTIVPGITSITSIVDPPDALIGWANRIGLEGISKDKYVDELATIGTLTHYLIECFLRGEKPELDDYTPNQYQQAKLCFQKFLDWEKRNKLEVLEMEVELVSEIHKFGGRGDVFAKLNGEVTYIDFKTSKWCFLGHKVQGVANKKVYEEKRGKDCPGVFILRLGRSPAEGFEEIPVDKTLHDDMWKMFLHAKAIYDYRKYFRRI